MGPGTVARALLAEPTLGPAQAQGSLRRFQLALTECDQPGGVTELEGVVAFANDKL